MTKHRGESPELASGERGRSASPRSIDVVGRMGVFGCLSAALVLGSIVAITTIGLNEGIDFSGGYSVYVHFPKAITETEIKAIVEPLSSDVRVQHVGALDSNEYFILVREHGTINEDHKRALRKDVEALVSDPAKIKEWSMAESGESLNVKFAEAVSEEALRGTLAKLPVQVSSVTRSEREDEPSFAVTFVSIAGQIERALREKLKLAPDVELVKQVEFVGPAVGEQLRNQGLMATVYALIFILIYIAVRFDMFFAPGAVIALIHDVVITVGVFSVFQLEFNLPFVAAILALIGYSLNDTIVVYDRIRENIIRQRGRALRERVNSSINETFSRTIVTSGTTQLAVTAMVFFGGNSIRDFSLALFVGIIVGTYSSVFVASPIYIFLHERFAPEQRKHPAAVSTTRVA